MRVCVCVCVTSRQTGQNERFNGGGKEVRGACVYVCVYVLHGDTERNKRPKVEGRRRGGTRGCVTWRQTERTKCQREGGGEGTQKHVYDTVVGRDTARIEEVYSED